MRRFRSVLFWLHLATGLIAGVAIAIMCFTGVLLAFEHEIVAWSERDARRVEVPTDATRLPLAELRARVEAARPGLQPTSITLLRDPAAAVVFSAGRDASVYVNPYTGAVREPASTRVRDFMRTMRDWHRYLGREEASRPVGKLINGICNLAFCGLAITGLYLWWPRRWTWRNVRATAVLNWRLTGRARDFNWHNTIGLWCAPILIVLTLTAVPISFSWGHDLVYRLVSEEPAPRGRSRAANGSGALIAPPATVGRAFDGDDLVARLQRDFPRWEQIVLRIDDAPRSGAGAAVGVAAVAADNDSHGSLEPRPPLVASIREAGSWPRTASTTLNIDPFTGEVLRREGFADLSTGRQIRTWTRFLHTGEAVGWGGQLVAGLACLGGLFLVYTGFALSWRRFFGKARTPAIAAVNKPASAETVASAR